MDFFISDAYAQAAGGAAPAGGSGMSLVMLMVFVLIFYFMLWRPQSKRAKEHRKMVENLKKGDEVVTTGGLLGKISEISDGFVVVSVSDNTSLTFQKQSVASVVPKGTLKSVEKK